MREERRHDRVDVHLYVHLDGPVNINLTVQDLPTPPGPAVAAHLRIGGSMSAGTITVDTQGETITLEFTDDQGNATAAPEGAVIAFTSSNEAIATITPDASNPLQGDVTITPGAGDVGVVEFGATSNGTALEADGTTPIPDPAPISVTVDPGAAVGERLASNN